MATKAARQQQSRHGPSSLTALFPYPSFARVCRWLGAAMNEWSVMRASPRFQERARPDTVEVKVAQYEPGVPCRVVQAEAHFPNYGPRSPPSDAGHNIKNAPANPARGRPVRAKHFHETALILPGDRPGSVDSARRGVAFLRGFFCFCLCRAVHLSFMTNSVISENGRNI
jgi:hypothetical protein